MEDAASSNAALMRRIVQLERERDDLRKDVETLCMQQSRENFGGGDFMSRLNARRLAGLDQELESYRNKLTAYKRENENLQEELTDVYNIKGQVSELLKSECEKNKKLEQELKFFQTKVASSIGERDKLFLEIERLRSHQQALEEDIKTSFRRHQEALKENEENYARSQEMENNLTQLNSQIELYNEVVSKFWQLRHSNQVEKETDTIEKAKTLLSDSEGSWSFGDVALVEKQVNNRIENLEATTLSLAKDLAAAKTEAERLREQEAGLVKAKQDAESSVVDLEMRMLKFGACLGSTVQELYICQRRLKNDVSTMFKSEKNFFKETLNTFQELAEKIKTAETSCSTTGSRITSDSSDTATSTEVIEGNKSTQAVVSHDAFLQALQDKVSALMLLSQEEERHHLECKTAGALEYQLEQLNEKLSQVTMEKVEALMQVAHLKYACEELKDRERDLLKLLERPSSSNTGGKLLPASWASASEPVVVGESPQQRTHHPSTSSYLKSWLRRGE